MRHDEVMASSRWSLWSEDSVLSIGSRGSVLSIGSVGSALSVGSVGSFASLLSVGSAFSVASLLSAQSCAAVMYYRSARAVMAAPPTDNPPRLAGRRAGVPSYAAWLGGPWLCRVRVRSGLVAVVVPSLLSRSCQPHRWIAVR